MLVLVGSGEYLPAMDPVDSFLLSELGRQPKVVCLPTAAGTEGDERLKYWSNLGVDHFTRLGADARALPVITRQDAQNEDLAGQVRLANFVYLSGGRPEYLLQVLKDSLVWQAIQQVLVDGGILAGCSAGAMIMGAKIPGFPRARPAFNLLPKAALVIPHLDEVPSWFIPVARSLMSKRMLLVGIPGSTALIVHSGSSQVLGRGNVVMWGKDGRRQIKPNETLAW